LSTPDSNAVAEVVKKLPVALLMVLILTFPFTSSLSCGDIPTPILFPKSIDD
jgi:hypothetical protein